MARPEAVCEGVVQPRLRRVLVSNLDAHDRSVGVSAIHEQASLLAGHVQEQTPQNQTTYGGKERVGDEVGKASLVVAGHG